VASLTYYNLISSISAVVAIAIGSIGGLVAVVLLCFWYFCLRNKEGNQDQNIALNESMSSNDNGVE
jgi:hypothetical protein